MGPQEDIQETFHLGHELANGLPYTAPCRGRAWVHCSTTSTVIWPMCSTHPGSTRLSASIRKVHRAAPPGGTLWASTGSLASVSPVTYGRCPGRGRPYGARSVPTLEKRRPTLPTVPQQLIMVWATSSFVHFWAWPRWLTRRLQAPSPCGQGLVGAYESISL